MKVLLIHSDFIEYEAKKKATKAAEAITDDQMKGRMEEALVVFTAVEKGDEKTAEALIQNYANEVVKTAQQLGTNKVMLYPYAHLSSSLSDPGFARDLFPKLEQAVAEKGLEVHRSPFGWYKSFNISCKGHPLSELSRDIATEVKEEENAALVAEKSLESHWYILDTQGELVPALDFDYKGEDNLKRFFNYEHEKVRAAKKDPPHIKLMQEQELLDYEPGSDPGHFRWFPKGKLVKDLLEMWVTGKVVEAGGLPVETPIMYDYEHPSLKKYLNRFPARQYTIETPNKRVFLRFAACFGQFLIMHDSMISYKHLPLWLYEMTHYSFRVEQRGELSGLRRLRAFTMPDCHAFCADIPQAKEEMLKRFRLAQELQEGVGLEMPQDLELAIRITKDFYEENKDFVAGMVKEWGKPALVEMWDDRFFYFVMKYELNFVDALDKASALTTDQIDVENAKTYGMTYVDSDNQKKPLIVLHLSPSGAIERVLYAILEKQAKRMARGEKAELPFWLAPTQVRLIPLNDDFLEYTTDLAGELDCRVDIDDREEKVGKKIREAEKEWVPMILVIGGREKESGEYSVRLRTGEQVKMDLDAIQAKIAEGREGFPYMALPLPKLLSKRPIFRG